MCEKWLGRPGLDPMYPPLIRTSNSFYIWVPNDVCTCQLFTFRWFPYKVTRLMASLLGRGALEVQGVCDLCGEECTAADDLNALDCRLVVVCSYSISEYILSACDRRPVLPLGLAPQIFHVLTGQGLIFPCQRLNNVTSYPFTLLYVPCAP